ADVREAIARAVLKGGPQTAAQLGVSVGAVIIDKGSTNSAPFYASMGRGRSAIVRHWESSGWRVAQDTPHLWVLIPRRGKPSTQASWASPTSLPPCDRRIARRRCLGFETLDPGPGRLLEAGIEQIGHTKGVFALRP